MPGVFAAVRSPRARCALAAVGLAAACATPYPELVEGKYRLAFDRLKASAPAGPTCHVGAWFEIEKLTLTVVSPAAHAAGLRPGDRLRSVDSQTVVGAADVTSAIRPKPVGAELRLGVRRDAESLEFRVRCQDARVMHQRLQDVVASAAVGSWDACIAGTRALDEEFGPASVYSSIRLDCSEARRHALDRGPDEYDAGFVHEHRRRVLDESRWSPDTLEQVQPDVLFAIGWLHDHGFDALGRDLKERLDRAAAPPLPPDAEPVY